jgi:general L-amino acid transport system permease protein
MTVHQPIAPGAGERTADPRYTLVVIFAILTVVIFFLTAGLYYFDGNLVAPFQSIASIFGGIVSLDFGRIFSFISLVLLLFPIAIAYRVVSWLNFEGKQSYAGNVFNDSGLRNFFFEMLLLAFLGFLFWFVVGNAVHNLAEANIASGFGFLSREAGFGINFSPFLAYQETSSYQRVFLVGLQNTLIISFLGIVLATMLGFVIGIARLADNWVISRLAYVYVEVMRNIPLLLWIFIWYFSVLRLLPSPRDSVELGWFGFLNIRGLTMPEPLYQPGAGWIAVAFGIAVVAAWALSRWARSRQMATGQQFPVFWASVGLIVGLPVLAYLLTGMPIEFERPTMSTFGARGGMAIPPEFLGLLMALTTYTSSYIAEIVRAGILAVNKGQTEAAHALGLRSGPTLRLVVIPQAMRVIIPPMTNQYLNLAKNSSLAVAIAYPDLVSVFAGTALNQTGQAVEILLMTMLTYLAMSLLTSLFMNWFNARMALVER